MDQTQQGNGTLDDSRRMQREFTFTHVMLTSKTADRTGVGTTVIVVPTIVLVEEGWAV